MTKEQLEAFDRANAACSVSKKARGQYVIMHPWDTIDGPRTETVTSSSYIRAVQRRVEYVAFYALRALGYDSETAEWAVGYYPKGSAIDVFKRALAKVES